MRPSVAARRLLSTIPPHWFTPVPQMGDRPLYRATGLMQHLRSFGINRLRADLYFHVRQLLRSWRHHPARAQVWQWLADLRRERERERERERRQRERESAMMKLRDYTFYFPD